MSNTINQADSVKKHNDNFINGFLKTSERIGKATKCIEDIDRNPSEILCKELASSAPNQQIATLSKAFEQCTIEHLSAKILLKENENQHIHMEFFNNKNSNTINYDTATVITSNTVKMTFDELVSEILGNCKQHDEF